MSKLPSRRDMGLGLDVRREPKKRNPRKTAVNMADKYASLDTRIDDKCVLADKHECKGSIVCGHLFSRIAYSTRWEERNLYCLCSWANMTMENDPMVAEQLLDYARSLWGRAEIEELHRLYESARPVKTFEIQEYAAIWKESYEKHLAEEGGNGEEGSL